MKDGHPRGSPGCEQHGIRTHFWGSNYARRGRGGFTGGAPGRNQASAAGTSGGTHTANIAAANDGPTDSDGSHFAQAHFAAPKFVFAANVVEPVIAEEINTTIDAPHVSSEPAGYFQIPCNRDRARPLVPNANEVSALLAVTPSTAATIVDHFIDSGCSQHMTPVRESFVKYTKLKQTINIELADGNITPAVGFGTMTVPAVVNDDVQWVSISNVLHVPRLAKALISVSQLGKKDLRVLLNGTKGTVALPDGQVVLEAICEKGLYRVNLDHQLYVAHAMTHYCNAASTESAMLWHRRFAHLGQRNLHNLAYRSLVDGLPAGKWEPLEQCEVCAREKTVSFPHRPSNSRASDLLELVHLDLMGPYPERSLGGGLHGMVFTDDHSRHLWVHVVSNRSEAPYVLRAFLTRAKIQKGKTILRLRTDRAPELGGQEKLFNEFAKVCDEFGIIHEFSPPYEPASNGRSERPNRTLMDRVMCMLDDGNLPKALWGEMLQTAAYLINRSPHSSIGGQVPFTLWFGRKPDVSNLRIIGSKCWYLVPKKFRQKLDQRARQAFLVGYEGEHAWRVWDKELNRVIISRNVVFHEPGLPALAQPTGPSILEFGEPNRVVQPPAPNLQAMPTPPVITDALPKEDAPDLSNLGNDGSNDPSPDFVPESSILDECEQFLRNKFFLGPCTAHPVCSVPNPYRVLISLTTQSVARTCRGPIRQTI